MTARRVVIIGGGFGGVTLARRLERVAPADTEVVLISSENHLVFTPLLPETAGREIFPHHIVVPGRQILRRTQWVTAQVTGIDPAASLVQYTSRGGERATLDYDHLVLACGSVADFSAVPGLAEHAYPMKTLGDAVFLSNDLIGRMEEAALQSCPQERQRLLTVVVIGGGFSGVEVAGSLNDLLGGARRFYPQLRGMKPRIILLQRGERILPEFHAASLSDYATRKLRSAGVEVCLRSGAQEVTPREVVLGSGERIPAGTVICTVGNGPNPLLRTLDAALDRGRLTTDPDMRVAGYSNIWALGDGARITNSYDGRPSPATAQFAMRQGRQLAGNLASVLAGKPTRPFFFRPLGMMASIGRHKAVAEVLGFRISGFLAWFFWRTVYLAKMPTGALKIEIALDWTRRVFAPPSIVQVQLNRTSKTLRAGSFH